LFDKMHGNVEAHARTNRRPHHVTSIVPNFVVE
jgi:hypothetical protein